MSLFGAVYTLKSRLLVIVFWASTLSIIVTSVSLNYLSLQNQKSILKDEMQVVAAVLAEESRLKLKHKQRSKVIQGLQSLRIHPSVNRACIYDAKEMVFAYYPVLQHTAVEYNSVGKQAFCPPLQKKKSYYEGEELRIVQEILFEEELIGVVYLSINASSIADVMRQQVLVTLLIVALSLLLALVFGSWARQAVSEPLQDLAAIANRISQKKDFSIRADETKKGKSFSEITAVTSAFNQMLEEVEKTSLEMRQKTLELEKAKESAESSNLSKSRFLASIGHELRTPLNAIIGFSSIISSQLFGDINPRYHEYAEDIHESGIHLLDIINDILDLSKAETGKLKLEMEEFVLEKSVKKAMAVLEETANQSKVSVQLEMKHNEDYPHIIADRMRFVQVLINLLSNAIRFTPAGGHVLIQTNVQPISKGRLRVQVKVKDNGIGMSKDNINKALQCFDQVDAGLNRRHEGMGLGLPLSQKLIELHHGSLSIESEEGKGTEVTILLDSNPALLLNYTNGITQA